MKNSPCLFIYGIKYVPEIFFVTSQEKMFVYNQGERKVWLGRKAIHSPPPLVLNGPPLNKSCLVACISYDFPYIKHIKVNNICKSATLFFFKTPRFLPYPRSFNSESEE